MILSKVDVKFEIVPLSYEILSDDRIPQLSHWCELFHEQNLAPPYEGGSYGNLSFKESIRDSFIITLSQSSLEDAVNRSDFALVTKVDFETGKVFTVLPKKGTKPSSEAMVHRAGYEERPKAGAIFHGQSDLIGKYAETLEIPVTLEEKPYGTLALVEQVRQVLRSNPESNLVQMRNHGFLALGYGSSPMNDAGNRVLEYMESIKQLERV